MSDVVREGKNVLLTLIQDGASRLRQSLFRLVQRAKAEGQRAMLESLGMTEEAIGAEIRATMETVEVARTADGMPLYLDRPAAGADRILPVNRIKPHTCFKGPIESGVTKMAVVGFGKQPGAAQIHACGPVEMRNRILNGIEALRATGRVLGGVASIESAAALVAINTK